MFTGSVLSFKQAGILNGNCCLVGKQESKQISSSLHCRGDWEYTAMLPSASSPINIGTINDDVIIIFHLPSLFSIVFQD